MSSNYTAVVDLETRLQTISLLDLGDICKFQMPTKKITSMASLWVSQRECWLNNQTWYNTIYHTYYLTSWGLQNFQQVISSNHQYKVWFGISSFDVTFPNSRNNTYTVLPMYIMFAVIHVCFRTTFNNILLNTDIWL